MLFTSIEYLFVFLPVVFFTYHLLLSHGPEGSGKVFLCAASLFFYSYWDIAYLPLLLSSIIINYYIGLQLASVGRNALLLYGGVFFNILLLSIFKYYFFLISNVNSLFSLTIPVVHFALPLAISFFTFQQIAFLVQCAQQRSMNYSFLDYLLFVSFFPQLIAGPIVKCDSMIPQFSKRRISSARNYERGIFLLGMGAIKKLIIADTFAKWANAGFDSTQILTFWDAWAVSCSYTFQLYYDFSGYTEMAIGSALLFNIQLPENFNSPYQASTIQDFWRRWHITLSTWLRDYIYIPLGGNKVSQLRKLRNVFVTFLLGGLWHGAGWTFILWGALHGLALAVHSVWKRYFKMNYWGARVCTFLFLNISWVFFRAQSFERAEEILRGMVGWNGIAFPIFLTKIFHVIDLPNDIFMSGNVLCASEKLTFIWLFVFGGLAFFFPNTSRFVKKEFVFSRLGGALLGGALSFALLYSFSVSTQADFLYFNF